MDFHFVPNLTFGAKVLQDITNKKKINVDIHFMVKVKGNLEFFLKEYFLAKPKMMTMHYESLKSRKKIRQFIELCHKHNVLASIAISPKTSVKKIIPYLRLADNVLVMSVEPGFGGQKFMPIALPKLKFLDKYRQRYQLKYQLEVDGGINNQNLKEVQANGVDMIVMGSYFFENKNFKTVIKEVLSPDESTK
jgi:ribulose-phosphate 3-epimerase